MIIKMSGGLGNQFFQYAFARRISELYGEKIYIDALSYRRDKKRKYELDLYNIRKSTGKKWVMGVANILLLLKQKTLAGKLFHMQWEQKVLCQQKIVNPSAYYIGFWQNQGYFCEIKEILMDELKYMEDLSEKQKEVLQNIRIGKSVAMHVRRGDYLSTECIDSYRNLPREYYERAMKMLRETVGDFHIYMFSDDIEWCKKEYSDLKDVTFVDSEISTSQHIDFELMRNCKHFIIANSTFSWWASWLATNDEKIVISPEKWFYDEDANVKMQKALLKGAILL